MQPIKTITDVSASAEIVWRVLTDFASYPKWNPLLRNVLGDPVKGERLKIRARLSPRSAHWLSARVVKAVPAMELCWRGRLWIKGLFDGEYASIIIPDGVKGIRFVQRVSFSGLLVPLILPFIHAKVEARLELASMALKKTAEAKH